MDLRKYFIDWEISWILLVYESSTETSRRQFQKHFEFKYREVQKEEKEKFKEHLISCREFVNVHNFDATKYYKTRFVNILDLINQREIFIDKGFAYFPEDDLIHLIKCHFRSEFKEQLLWNAKMLPNVINKDQFRDFLHSLPIISPRTVYSEDLDVTMYNLEDTFKDHFPLCMRQIHKILKQNHHLKHDCRMQYGIFLKNLGLPYDDAMQFFEQEFTQSMSKDWFKRKYSYYFKHYYGKVGGRLDYKPYSCKFVQEMTPGPGQKHGCPFKHWDKPVLMEEIKNDSLCSRDLRDIEDLILEKRYQSACTRYFCATRKARRDTLIESPNEYCAESIRIEDCLPEHPAPYF